MKNALPLITAGILLCSFNTDSIQKSVTQANLKGKVRSIQESVYTAEAKVGDVEKGKLIYKDSTAFNENGDALKWRHFDGDGSLKKQTDWTFGDDNKITGALLKIGKDIDHDTLIYDASGNLIEEDIYKVAGRIATKYTYKYEGDYMTEAATYNGSSLKSKIVYSYGGSGKVFLEDHYSGNDINEKMAYTYNDKGDAIKVETYDPHGKLESKATFKYDEYDDAGNWRKCTKLVDDKPESITTREIEYY